MRDDGKDTTVSMSGNSNIWSSAFKINNFVCAIEYKTGHFIKLEYNKIKYFVWILLWTKKFWHILGHAPWTWAIKQSLALPQMYAHVDASAAVDFWKYTYKSRNCSYWAFFSFVPIVWTRMYFPFSCEG